MSKIANMLNMLQILKDKEIHNISSLAENLEVSERMIRQYKLELEQAGIYLKSFTGKYGGYQLDKNSNFLKIENEVKEKMYIVMKKAIFNKNKVKIRYDSINSGITQKNYTSSRIIFIYRQMVYCSICELRNEIRLFKLENIKEYEVLEDVYTDKNIIKNNCDKIFPQYMIL